MFLPSSAQAQAGLTGMCNMGGMGGGPPEMEYCASAASMLAEEIWQIAEGFVEVLRKYVGSI